MVSIVVVGALARIDVGERERVHHRLSSIDGVGTFELGMPEKLGILIEAASIDAARGLLEGPIRQVAGVLGVWPVSLEQDDDSTSRSPVESSGPV